MGLRSRLGTMHGHPDYPNPIPIALRHEQEMEELREGLQTAGAA